MCRQTGSCGGEDEIRWTRNSAGTTQASAYSFASITGMPRLCDIHEIRNRTRRPLAATSARYLGRATRVRDANGTRAAAYDCVMKIQRAGGRRSALAGLRRRLECEKENRIIQCGSDKGD